MTAGAAGGEAWQAVAGDATGRLYGVIQQQPHSSSSTTTPQQPGTAVIVVAEVAPDALSSSSGSGSTNATSPLDNSLAVVQLVVTSPPVGFTVTAAAASPNGHQLLLAGVSQQDDVDVPVLALVDLYGALPAAAPPPGSSSSSSAAAFGGLPGRHPGAKLRAAGLFAVHPSLYEQRPGMQILQVSWHPSSPSHFAVLATDNRWRLYSTRQLAEAEQTFWLKLPGSTAASVGLQHRRPGAACPPRVTAFAFGPPATPSSSAAASSGAVAAAAAAGWSSLAVFFLASDGGLYVLCPVAPFGLRIRAGTIRGLPGIDERGTVHAWLLAAFLEVLSNEAAPTVTAQPHVLETLAPALQGPLNAGAASLKPATARRVACSLALSCGGGGEHQQQQQQQSFNAEDAAAAGAAFAALLSGFSSGAVYAHALQLGQVVPCWQDATPQVAYDHRGEVAAVRYECDALAVRPATSAAAGLGSVPEDTAAADSGGINSSSSPLASPLLLLDALKVNLHLQQQQQRQPGGGTGLGGRLQLTGRLSPADSDEESDAGYDPSAAGQHEDRGRRGLSDDDTGFGGGGDDDDDDDDDDVEEEQLQQLRRVTLLAAPQLAGRFWVAHDQGAWGVNVRWLAQLNGGDAAALLAGHQQLAPPALAELLVSAAGVAGCCVVGNALLGSGAVVLERGAAGQQQGPQLMFLRPRPAGVLDGAEQQMAGAGLADAAGAAAAGADGGACGLAELQLSSEEAGIKAAIEEHYADITCGPRRVQPPPKPANLAQLSPADPAGLQYLQAATSWLLAGHVAFGAGAAADMLKRVNDLHELVGDQQQSVVQLRALADAATTRQADLQARIDRLSQASQALAERGSLLAGLHWGMPRTASRAEQRLDRQLDVWEKRCGETRTTWSALAKRIDALSAEARKQQRQQSSGAAAAGGAAGGYRGVPALAAARARERAQLVRAGGGGLQQQQSPGGPLAAAQLERAKGALMAQHAAIAQHGAQLDELVAELEAWRADHPEAELPALLARLAAGGV